MLVCTSFNSLPRNRHVFLPHERLLNRAGIYVDQSLRSSRFWKCSLDREKFWVRSWQENCLLAIAVVIKEKVERINFMLWDWFGFTFISALFHWSRFVWITAYLVVLRLRFSLFFQIVETLGTKGGAKVQVTGHRSQVIVLPIWKVS